MMIGFLPWDIRCLTGFTTIGFYMVYLSPGIYPSIPTSLWQKEESSLLSKTFKSWILPAFILICHSPLYSSAISCFQVFLLLILSAWKSFCLLFCMTVSLSSVLKSYIFNLPNKYLLNTHYKHCVRIGGYRDK